MNGGGMTRLSIVQIAGQYCGTHLEGEKIFFALVPLLKSNEHVELDFAQVELASSSFFNEIFGRITEEFGETALNKQLSFTSLKPRHVFVLERTRDAATA